DLVYYGNQQRLEYDFVVAPGVDPKAITLAFQGAGKVELNAQGDLVLHTTGGPICQPRPVIYQEVNGERREIAGGYVLKDGLQVGFQVAAYDGAKPLVIDPQIDYSTYIGGDGADSGNAIAVDDQRFVYVTGETTSVNFPSTVGAFDTQLSNGVPPDQFIVHDAFVTKIDPNAAGAASLVYSTYLGGGGGGGGITGNDGLDEAGLGIAVDDQGNAYITGKTSATDFPIVNAFQDQLNRDGVIVRADAFVAELNADGSDLLYSSYLGGNGIDVGNAIAVDDQGHAYITGETTSSDFPTLGRFQGFAGNSDVFVAHLNPAESGLASLVFASFLGGSGTDIGHGIALDPQRKVHVTGQTASTNFPTKPSNAFQAIYRGGASDAFVAKIDPTLACRSNNPFGCQSASQIRGELLYSTYLG
ncbi:MAG: SBBP repeat-containing protein, partial [Gammaproteobacteria bacterium]